MGASAVNSAEIAPFLDGRPLADWCETFDRQGYVIFERVLPLDQVEAVRAAVAAFLKPAAVGRTAFEGHRTNRLNAVLAKAPLLAEVVIHPLALAFVEMELGRSCLLSALQAISLQPGEVAQHWHFDDGHITIPRPRPAYGVSAFWAIDETTELNGATEVIPGSHLWGDDGLDGAAKPSDFREPASEAVSGGPAQRTDVVKMAMPAGSLALVKGTTWHRGGANRSSHTRLIIAPQYCPGWARQIENMSLAVPPEVVATLPKRAREILGYSIHPPSMGNVDGVHPGRSLPDPA